jgi:hypothetical protein
MTITDPLGAAGWQVRPIGFAHSLPHFARCVRCRCIDIMAALLAYDVVGLPDRGGPAGVLMPRPVWAQLRGSADVIVHAGRRARTVPIGVDADAIRRSVERNKASRCSTCRRGSRIAPDHWCRSPDYSGLARTLRCPSALPDTPAASGRRHVPADAPLAAELRDNPAPWNSRRVNQRSSLPMSTDPHPLSNRNFPHLTLLGFLRLARSAWSPVARRLNPWLGNSSRRRILPTRDAGAPGRAPPANSPTHCWSTVRHPQHAGAQTGRWTCRWPSGAHATRSCTRACRSKCAYLVAKFPVALQEARQEARRAPRGAGRRERQQHAPGAPRTRARRAAYAPAENSAARPGRPSTAPRAGRFKVQPKQ